MKHYQNWLVISLFLCPALLLIVLFLYYPFFMSFFRSFFKWDGFFTSEFIGLANYKRMFMDTTIHKALKNTMYLMFLACFIQVGIGLIIAVFTDSISKGAKFYRTVFFFPIVISSTAIGLMFKLFYVYDGGLLNTLLNFLNLESVVWLTEKSAMTAVAVPVIWQYVGFYFVILLTAIGRIPDDIYESAYLDGINGFEKTIYFTIPLIWDVIKVCFILAITGALKVFDLIYVITQGGPLRASEVLGTYMYQKTFVDYRYGYGSTIAILIVVLGLVISYLVNRHLRREEVTY